jgi:hypothetical protein
MENKLAKLGSFPIYLFLFVIFIQSCKPTKSLNIINEKIRIDTIRDYKVITRFNAVHDTLIIENPCDSTGILNTFYSKITVPQGKIIIRSYKGNIQATINIDSIENVYKNMYVSSLHTDSLISNKEKVTNIIPTWCLLTILFQGLIIFGYIYIKFFYV